MKMSASDAKKNEMRSNDDTKTNAKNANKIVSNRLSATNTGSAANTFFTHSTATIQASALQR